MTHWGKFKMPGVIVVYLLYIAATVFAIHELHWLGLFLTIPLGFYVANWTDNEHKRTQAIKRATEWVEKQLEEADREGEKD